MRRLLPLLVLLAAAPAAAQDAAGLQALQLRQMELNAQQDLDRTRAVSQQNDISTLDARLRTDQNLRDLQAHGLQTQVPAPLVMTHPLSAAELNPGRYPSIPDAALAASRARVVAASRNRR